MVLLSLGLVLMGSFWAFLPPFRFLFAEPPTWRWGSAPWAAGIGFILAVGAFWLGRGRSQKSDLSSFQARVWLALILAIGAVVRLYRFDEPHPTWGYDPYWELMEARNTAELGLHGLLFQLGSREPLFHYLMVALWWLFPEGSPFVVSRVASLLLDLAAVWVFYLAGKELAGRRAGIFAAALGAASKPMIIMTIACTRGVSVTLAAAFVILFTLRVLKRQDLRHFLQWGLVLGVAAYTYTGIRVLLVWAGWSVLAFCYLSWEKDGGTRRRSGPDRLAALMLFLAGGSWLILEFLKVNAYLNVKVPGVEILSSGIFLSVLFAITVAAGVVLWRLELRDKSAGLKYWLPGMLLACLIILPLVLHPFFANHLSHLSLFTMRSAEEAWMFIPRKILAVFKTLFLGGEDRYDLNILGDTFLDLVAIPAILMGFAALAARPTKFSIWLFLAAAAGVAPHALSEDPHSVKLMSGLPALLMLAGAALSRVWDWIGDLFPGKTAGWISTAFFAVLGLAGLQAVHGRVWGAFAAQEDPNGKITGQVFQEAPGKRLFFAQAGDFFLPHQQLVQLDGRIVTFLRSENTIGLLPGEAVPPVVVYFCKGDEEYGDAKAVWEKLAKAYPGVPWTEVPLNWRHMWRMEIPPSRIGEGGTGLFHVRRVPAPAWRRYFYYAPYGLGRGGMLWHQDLASLPDSPVPPGVDSQSIRISGTLSVPRDGKVEFELSTRNYVRLRVGERDVIHHRPSQNVSESGARAHGDLHLKAGVHPVEMRIYLRGEGIPSVRVTLPGVQQPRRLGEI